VSFNLSSMDTALALKQCILLFLMFLDKPQIVFTHIHCHLLLYGKLTLRMSQLAIVYSQFCIKETSNLTFPGFGFYYLTMLFSTPPHNISTYNCCQHESCSKDVHRLWELLYDVAPHKPNSLQEINSPYFCVLRHCIFSFPSNWWLLNHYKTQSFHYLIL
jgi:hypothetical protein